eukprot:7031996-Alexandrium_andersonii.AAC.1
MASRVRTWNAQFQVRTREAILACSITAGATRFDRFDSLLSSIGSPFTCHRVPPWKARMGDFARS